MMNKRSPSVEFAPLAGQQQQMPSFFRPRGPPMGHQIIDPIRLKSQRQNPIPSFEQLQQQKTQKQKQQQPPKEESKGKDDPSS
jgi:hypothetical protein